MPFYLFFPRPRVDFWLFPDRYFDETYELNYSWDFFGDPDYDESYSSDEFWPSTLNPVFDPDYDESYDSDEFWPGTANPVFDPDYENFTELIEESYEDGYWHSNEQANSVDTTSMTLWLDAQDNSFIILDGYGNVSTWLNKVSSAAGDASQASASSRPGITTFDGYQFLSFTPSQWLSMSHTSGALTRVDGTNSRNWHFFAVFTVTYISTNSGTFTANDGLFTTDTSITRHDIAFRNSPNRVVLAKQSGSFLTTTSNINLGEKILVEMRQRTEENVNVWEVYVNETFITSQGDTTTSGNTITYIGRNVGGTAFFYGLLGEIMMYRRTLLTGERNRVISYLKNKWGIV